MGQNKDLVCYRKKQSFRQCAWGLRQLVLKPGFRPKGRALGMLEKSENFNSLRPILYELCKKNYRGGGQIFAKEFERKFGNLTIHWIYQLLEFFFKFFIEFINPLSLSIHWIYQSIRFIYHWVYYSMEFIYPFKTRWWG